jgi:hypothetical protein
VLQDDFENRAGHHHCLVLEGIETQLAPDALLAKHLDPGF